MSNMTRREFFFLSIQKRMYHHLEWALRSFSITLGESDKPFVPYYEDKKWFFKDDEGGVHWIQDAKPDQPIFSKRDPVTIKKGEFTGAVEDGETTYTRILWHCVCVVYAYGDRIPFKLGGRTISELEGIVSAGLVDWTENDADVPEGKFSVNMRLKDTEALGSILTGYAQLFTPSTTVKSLITDPKIKQLKAQRLKENADRLSDPAVISSIKNELIAVDKKWLEGDSAADFLIDSKSYNQVRVMAKIMHGEESAFTDGTQVKLISTSVDEGWNLDNLPEYNNSARQASFLRGSETALGGELAQILIRIFQNHIVTALEDCGTKTYLYREFPASNATYWYGTTVVEGGKNITVDENNFGMFVGKVNAVRSPQYCYEKGNGYCKTCIGAVNSLFPEGLGGQALDIGSTILYIFMKKAHGSALKTTPWSFEQDLY